MGRVLICVGKYANNPYHFEKAGLHIYSIEELCYCFCKNAFLLDRDVLNKKLVDWIDEELQLKDLAHALYGFINAGSSVSAFVSTVLEYTGYLPAEQVEKTERLLKNNANLSDFERRKTKADYFLENKRYGAALEEYEKLICNMDSEKSDFFAKILHNIGVTCTRLFLFNKAAGYFEAAFKLTEDKEELICMLAAKRHELGAEKYISFVADNNEYYTQSLQLESKIKEYENSWQTEAICISLSESRKMREDGEKVKYYEATEKMMRELKEEYRALVEE